MDELIHGRKDGVELRSIRDDVPEAMKDEARLVILSRIPDAEKPYVEWYLRRALAVYRQRAGYTLDRAVNVIAPALALMLLIMSHVANAYPENVRFGYPSCAACHANGSGGGLLTQYGRVAASQVAATWSGENEGGLLHGAFGDPAKFPEWLLIDGNARSVGIDTLNPKSHRHFIMAAEGEVGLQPIKGLWLVGSAGVYGPEQRREYRRYFVQADLCDNASMRLGRFQPVFGLDFDDHTLTSRRVLGFDEGHETYAAEASARGSIGEVIATQTFGDAGQLTMNGAVGSEYATRAETMTIAKAGAFVGKSSQVGVSGLHAIGPDRLREAWGAYAIVAPVEWAYLMADWNRLQSSYAQPQTVGTTVLGVQPYRGVTLAAVHEYVEGERAAYGLQLRAVPRPHFELTARVKRQANGLASILMTHYWL